MRAAALFVLSLSACGSERPPSSVPPPPPSVPVVQTVPSVEDARYGWLPGRGLVYGRP